MAQLRAGAKRGHWIWFVFPQVRGLGTSATSQHFAIASRAEAAAYLAHPVLGPRLRACVQILLDLPPERTAAQVFAGDDVKVRSSLTLFAAAAQDGLFDAALRRFYAGEPDPRTLAILRESAD